MKIKISFVPNPNNNKFRSSISRLLSTPEHSRAFFHFCRKKEIPYMDIVSKFFHGHDLRNERFPHGGVGGSSLTYFTIMAFLVSSEASGSHPHFVWERRGTSCSTNTWACCLPEPVNFLMFLQTWQPGTNAWFTFGTLCLHSCFVPTVNIWR